jgi:hypothetical protein
MVWWELCLPDYQDCLETKLTFFWKRGGKMIFRNTNRSLFVRKTAYKFVQPQICAGHSTWAFAATTLDRSRSSRVSIDISSSVAIAEAVRTARMLRTVSAVQA